MVANPNATPIDPAQPSNDVLADSLDKAVSAAPTLVRSPITAVTVAGTPGDVGQNAQVVSHIQTVHAISHAANDASQGDSGFFGAIDSLGHDVGHYTMDAVKGAYNLVQNLTIRAAQHDFRYLVATEQRDGWGAALGEGLAMAVGAAAVGAATGGFGDLGLASLGAEGEAAEGGFSLGDAASSLGKNIISGTKASKAAMSGFYTGGTLGGVATGQVINRQLYQDTGSTKWVDAHGNEVSFGRVLAGMMGLKSGGARSVVSGTADGIFDMLFGQIPGLEQVSAARAADVDAQGVATGAQGLAHGWHGTAMTAENLEYIVNNEGKYGPAHRAAQVIADTDSPAKIEGMFPRLNAEGKVPPESVGGQWVTGADGLPERLTVLRNGAGEIIRTNSARFRVDSTGQVYDNEAKQFADGFISDLAKANTKDEVFDVYRRYLHVQELMNGSRVPTMSQFRLPLTRLRQAALDAESGPALPNLENKVRGDTTQTKGPLSKLWRGARRVAAPIVGSASASTWARRFQHVPGMEFDAETLRASQQSIDFVDNVLPAGMMRLLEQTQGGKYAKVFGDHWLLADPATRTAMLSGAHMSAIFGAFGEKLAPGVLGDMSAINDPAAREYLTERMQQLMGQFNPDAADRYGAYRSGMALKPSIVDEATGRKVGAGILLSQHGKGTMMTLTEIRRTADMLRSGQDMYGKMDDWLYRHATAGLFKRYVLLSAGYMSRITAAEDIPNALRWGTQNMVGAGIRVAYDKLGIKVDQDEATALQHYIYDMLSHVTGKMDPEKIRYTAEHGILTNATHLDPALDASAHSGSAIEDPADRIKGGLRARAAAGQKLRFGAKYEMYAPHDRWHLRQWRVWLGQIKKDPMSAKAAEAMHDVYARGGSLAEAQKAAEDAWGKSLKEVPPGVRRSFVQNAFKREGDPAEWTPEQSWVHHGVQNLIAATHTPEGAPEEGPLMDLLRPMAHGDKLPSLRIMRRIEENRRPLGVPGRELLPDGDSTGARIAGSVFKRMGHFINMMSRYEVNNLEYIKQRSILEADVKAGLISTDQAVTTASSRAAQEGTRWVHNLHDRSAWSETMKNWSPFWFAKEQAYRRMGRLLAEDPAAFRKYELLILGAHNVTVKSVDSTTGQNYVTLPGEGLLTTTVNDVFSHLGLPVGKINPVELGGDFNSLSVVFPTSNLGGEGNGLMGIGPDFGPVAIVPAKLMYGAVSAYGRRYSTFAKPAGAIQNLVNGVFGQEAISEPFVNDILPNTALQRTFEAFSANDSSFDSAMILTIQTMDYDQNVAMTKWVDGGRKGAEPDIVPPLNATYTQKQAFLARVKNMTQMNLVARAVLSLATPVTLEQEYQNFGLPTELQNDITAAGSVTKGMDAFLAKNPNATPYTVAESTHPGSLASITANNQTNQWLDANQSLINEFPEAAVWLMPQANTTDPYSQTAYNEQIADNLRVKDTPAQFLDAVYTAAGDQTYYAAYSEHQAAVNGANGNSSALDAEYNKWDSFVQQLQIQQPTWFANTTLFSATKQADEQQTILQLQQMEAAGKFPNSPQSDLVKQVLGAYATASAQYAAAGTSYGYTSAIDTVRTQWSAYIDQMKIAHPQIAPMLSSVFSGIFYVQQ